MSLFDYRDAFQDWVHVPTQSRYETGDVSIEPVVTIAIPTYRRPDVLLEAVESALRQESKIAFEILIVDNDPDGSTEQEIARLSSVAPDRPIRYMVNDKNIGMFGNWNRCIELARGEWITILNDDDLLRPKFLSRMMKALRHQPDADGIASRKLTYDRREGRPRRPEVTLRARVWDRLRRLRFNRNGLMQVSPRTLFFGNEIGNGLGFLFRRDTAITLGGYRPEDFPSSDGYLYLRMSVHHKLFWLYDILADIGIGDNESMRPETLATAVRQGDELRRTLAGKHVPQDWMRMHAQLMANSINDAERLWEVRLDRGQFEREFDLSLPPPDYRRVSVFRLLHRGF